MKRNIISILLIMLLVIAVSGCGVEYPNVLTIDGENVSLLEYNYYFSTMKLQAEQSVPADQIDMYWQTEKDGKTTYDILKDEAFNQMLGLRVVAKEAEKEGLSYDQEVLQHASEIRKQMLSIAPDESKFYEMTNTDSDTVTNISRMMALRNKLLEKHASEGKIQISLQALQNMFNENYLNASHILFMTVDESTNEPLPDDKKKEKKALAEKVLARIKSGEDFNALMNEFSEDHPENNSHYVFGEGEMVPEFEEATRALQPGDVSGIVESTFGYHIIKRLPLSAEAEPEAFNKAAQNLQSKIMSDYLDEKVDTWKKDFKIEENKKPIEKL